jgi:two-component system, LytTR family, sensor kinase
MDKNKNKPAFILLTILLVPAFVCTLNFVFFGTVYFSNISICGVATAITFGFSFLLSQSQIAISNRMRKKYPGYEQTYSRIINWIVVILFITPAFIMLLFLFYSWLKYPAPLQEGSWERGLLTGFVADITGIAFNEGIYTFSKWKGNIQETEQLKKANLQTQFDGLKHQVSPHFLFNSINTLSSLIHEDRERAEKFIDEMSSVYRYLLRNNEEELVTLQTELKFIQSYYHLLKTRYGAGIEMSVAVDKKTENYLLPPLTLQLLVENAVKHNNVLKGTPLLIEITGSSDGWLTVTNNLQKKTTKVDSSKIGLSNIKEKFRLLNQPDVVIKETPAVFVVKLPLIENMIKAVPQAVG